LADQVNQLGAIIAGIDGVGVALHIENEIDRLAQGLPLVGHACHPLPLNVQLVSIAGLLLQLKADEVKVFSSCR